MSTDTDYRQTTYALARLAECSDPDRSDKYGHEHGEGENGPSPGATFLRHVEDDARELWGRLVEDHGSSVVDRWEDADHDGSVHEIADGAPDVYTYTRWQEFTDLGAYQEDASEYGYGADDMTQLAGVCLYMIAERLVWALLREWAEEYDDDQEDDDQ